MTLAHLETLKYGQEFMPYLWTTVPEVTTLGITSLKQD